MAFRTVDDRMPVMADVARLAGVSQQTVSRVINDHPSVSPATRSRVELAIGQLGYRRNRAARALVTRESRTLGVVSVDISHYGPAHTLIGIEQAARQAGYFLNFVSLQYIDRANMRSAVHFLMDANVDGIVVLAPVHAAVEALSGLVLDVPVVRVACKGRGDPSSVSVDQAGGARLATRHLLSSGFDTIFHVRGPSDWLDAEAREFGWRSETADARAVAPPPLVGDWSPESGYAAGQKLARIPEARAIFVANDQMALGVLRALAEAGRSVPADVSVVGFDDIPESGFFLPPLTTIRQDFNELGRICIGRLIALIHGEDPGPSDPVETTLVIRCSTGPSQISVTGLLTTSVDEVACERSH